MASRDIIVFFNDLFIISDTISKIVAQIEKHSYEIAADYKVMIRFLKDKQNELAYLPETIISMYYGGTSTSSAGSYQVL